MISIALVTAARSFGLFAMVPIISRRRFRESLTR